MSLYRYAKYLNSQGIPLSDMDLTNYVKRSDELFEPLYNAIKDRLINQTEIMRRNVLFAKLHIDDGVLINITCHCKHV